MKYFYFYGANDTDALEMEMWAQEALVRLEENLKVAQLFNRDYEERFAEKGETINVHKLGSFSGYRLTEGAAISMQDVTAENFQVKLNQHCYVAYELSDRELQRAFKDLIQIYIAPGARALAEQIDSICMGESWQFMQTSGGYLTGDATYAHLVALNKAMNQNNNPKDSRALIVSPSLEEDLLNTDKLTEARMTGDGSPIINGAIGYGSGFDIGMSQTCPSIAGGMATLSGTINHSGGYLKGATSITVASLGAVTAVPTYVVIDGVPYLASAQAADSDETITLTLAGDGLRESVAHGDVVTVYTPGAINESDGYAAGYDGWIVIDGAATVTKFPEVGQGVFIATGQATETPYGIIRIDEANSRIMLNRPLDNAVSNNDVVCLTPSGDYGVAMRPGASTLVVHPMAAPAAGSGVTSAVAQYNGLAIRAMLSYNHNYMKNIFTLDLLAGVKTLDADQGALFFGQSD